jgi:glycosyltransferase involved in cell wall biosynthesis
LNCFLKYKKINLAIYYYSLKDGGAQRLTALLVNNLSKTYLVNIYLFINKNVNNEYKINNNIKRILINGTQNLIREIRYNKIDIIIYQFYNPIEIGILNKLNNVKTILYIHSCFLTWIYLHKYNFIRALYNSFKDSKYIISLIPFENDYLFPKWGINSILLNNFITYDYDNIIPSDLSSKIILMLGRGEDRRKRFYLGIIAMKYIIQEMPDAEMIIISKPSMYFKNLTKELKLENNIKFVGYTSKPEIYFKNASLHILPSSTESFGLSLCETKIYGIPNILTGIDYISPAKGGVINIYNDDPKTIAKEAIKILKYKEYRQYLGKEARKSMKFFKNEYTTRAWIKLILSISKGKNYYDILRKKRKKISKTKALIIIKKQIELLKKREPKFKNITVDKIINILKKDA